MPRRPARAPREPRSAEALYIRDLLAIWRRAQSLIVHGLNPLLAVWPSLRDDAYNPLVGQPRRRPVWQMTDLELQRIWPGIEPSDIRRHAPWATSRDEVLRVVFPGQDIPAGDLQVQEFLKRAVATARARSAEELDIEPGTPRAPGPGAFQMRAPFQAPTLFNPVTGEVLPPPPLPRVLSVRAVERQLEWLDVATHELVTSENLTSTVNAAGERVNRWTTKETRRIVAVDPTETAALGPAPAVPAAPKVSRRLQTIDPRLNPQVAMELRQWNLMNANLIESGIRGPIDGVRLRSLLSDVSETVRTAHAQGLRVEVLAQQLQDRFSVSDSRAALIARDQTLKLNGQLNRSKQQAAGVTHYRWATSRDERVRKSHQKLQGTLQSWSVPPSVGHPGEDYQCRCTAIPVIPELE